MDNTEGFEPITALFYSVFHPHEGTKVIHQVPNGSITGNSNNEQQLFDFDVIKNYVIPKPSLCNKLVTFKIGSYRILGFPVNIYAPHYARNSFNFNFCFVFPYDSDTTPYEGNVKRIGKMFRALEEQSQLLSKSLFDSPVYFNNNFTSIYNDNDSLDSNNKYLKVAKDWDNDQMVLNKEAPGWDNVQEPKLSSIESLIEQIYQDLNNYSECMIPIDIANSVDLKLFPIAPPPPHVHSFDVPLALVNLEPMIDPMWDPTLLKIVPFINGINSVGVISELSNSDYHLTKQCIQHLFHYKAIVILDIFQFNNRYAVTCDIGSLISDLSLGEQCQEFVISSIGTFDDLPIFNKSRLSDSGSSYHDFNNNNSIKKRPTPIGLHQLNSASTTNVLNKLSNNNKNLKLPLPSISLLFTLYSSLNQYITLKQWVIENSKDLIHIDVRKFIIFGVIKGIIYRVRSYPLMPKLLGEIPIDIENDMIPMMSNLNMITENSDTIEYRDSKKLKIEQMMELKLRNLVIKGYNMDAICTTLRVSPLKVKEMLSKIGDWDHLYC